MKLLPLLVFLTGCATTVQWYYDVDENQNDPIYIQTEKALDSAQKICGARVCIKRNIAMIVYEKGDLCALEHERKHARKGPKDSKKIIWCNSTEVQDNE